MNTRTRISAALLLAAAAHAAHAQVATSYCLIDLGSLGGQSNAMAINDAGDVAGFGSLAGNNAFRATKWTGALVQFNPSAGLTQAMATTINSAGDLFGVGFVLGDPDMHALRFDLPGAVDLGVFTPKGVNTAGDLVGLRNVSAAGYLLPQPCVFHASVLTTLALPTGSLTGQAMGINDAGWVVGSCLNAAYTTPRPTLWTSRAAAPTDLGTLAGTTTTGGQARAVNASGVIVGWSKPAATTPHATLWRTNASGGVTQRVDLGALNAASTSYANAVNNAELTVGTSNFHAFAWSGGAMVDLNTRTSAPGWTLEVATGVNNSGWIVGTGTYLGAPRAFLLQPGVRCGPADVGAQGGGISTCGDGILDNNDFVAYINLFFANDPRADFGRQGGLPGADGLFDNNDFVVFIDQFFSGC